MIFGLSNNQKAALVINEGQNGIIHPDYAFFPGLAQQASERGIIGKLATLADAFRAKGLPVFHTPVAHRPDFADVGPTNLLNALALKRKNFTVGSKEADYVDQLRPKDGDWVINRTSGIIGIVGTELDTLLRRLNVETIVLAGVSTNVGMPGNAMVAADLGYNVVIPEDCIAGSDKETHDLIVKMQLPMVATITSSEEVMAVLGAQ